MKYLAVIGLIVCPALVNAQVMFNNAVLTIDGAVLTANDSIINKGTVLNNGDFVVSGGWMNGGTYAPEGSGEAIFDGSGLQVIDHERQSFTKLVIRGGGKKIFLTDITVKNLVLENGVLESRNGATISIQPSGTVAGGSDYAHVVGPVRFSGVGDWIFPVGDGTHYAPVKVSGVTDKDASAIVALHDVGAQSLLLSPELQSISSERYWNFSTERGSLAGTRIALAINHESNLSEDPNLLTVAAAEDLPGPFTDLGSYATEGDRTAGWVTASNPTISGYYALASVFDEATGLIVHNALSPNGDGRNDMMLIENINLYPNNVVTIFNRWGDKVFVMNHYNNAERSFHGIGNVGNAALLPPSTYFYSIETKPGGSKITGYLVIR